MLLAPILPILLFSLIIIHMAEATVYFYPVNGLVEPENGGPFAYMRQSCTLEMCADDYFCNGWEEHSNRCHYGFFITDQQLVADGLIRYMKDRKSTSCQDDPVDPWGDVLSDFNVCLRKLYQFEVKASWKEDDKGIDAESNLYVKYSPIQPVSVNSIELFFQLDGDYTAEDAYLGFKIVVAGIDGCSYVTDNIFSCEDQVLLRCNDDKLILADDEKEVTFLGVFGNTPLIDNGVQSV